MGAITFARATSARSRTQFPSSPTSPMGPWSAATEAESGGDAAGAPPGSLAGRTLTAGRHAEKPSPSKTKATDQSRTTSMIGEYGAEGNQIPSRTILSKE